MLFNLFSGTKYHPRAFVDLDSLETGVREAACKWTKGFIGFLEAFFKPISTLDSAIIAYTTLRTGFASCSILWIDSDEVAIENQANGAVIAIS